MPVPSCTRLARRVLALASVGVLQAATAHAELPPGWSVHTFTGRIHEIETAGGVLACATDGGLLFYDPQQNVFAPAIADAGCSDGNCLSSNRLTSVSRDASGAYWLGTEASGAVVFRPGASGRRYERFFGLNASPGGGLLADSVSSIETWKSETVYVGTSQGVGQIDLAGGVDSYNPDAARRLGSDIKGSVLHDLAVDSLFVWVATDSGVSRYDRSPPYTVHFLPDSLVGPEAFTVEILNGIVHAGSSTGVFTWQEGSQSWQRLANPGAQQFKALAITRLAGGRIFAGSDGNVWTWNGFAWSLLNPPVLFYLEARSFATVAATGDTVWTCQQNAGGEGAFLETWSSASGWLRREANSVPPSEVKAIGVTPAGALWVGTRLAGIAGLTDGRWCIYNGNDPLVRPNMTDPEGHISALLAARDATVWFHALPQPGTDAAVDLLVPNTGCVHSADIWDHVAPEPPSSNGFGGRYTKIVEDGEGNVFHLSDGDASPANSSGGIDAVSADGARFLNIRSALAAAAVGALAFETETGVWARAYVGLNSLQNEGLYLWQRANQLFPPQVPPSAANFFKLTFTDSIDVAQYRDLAVTPSNPNLVWAGTDNGVFEYDVTARRVTVLLRAKVDGRAGLLSGDIKDLQFDAFGNLWVATVKGVNRIRLAERKPGQLSIDAFTTIEIIRELNGQSSVGQIYDPKRALAPLPAPKVNGLAYDAGRDLLHLGTEAGVASVDVQGLSQQPVVPLSSAVVYPNPARLDAGHQEVRIAHLSEPATVGIYTLEGQLVCESTDREDGDVVWTLGTPSCLVSDGNFRIASGAYLVRITTSAGSTMRTLVVIR